MATDTQMASLRSDKLTIEEAQLAAGALQPASKSIGGMKIKDDASLEIPYELCKWCHIETTTRVAHSRHTLIGRT